MKYLPIILSSFITVSANAQFTPDLAAGAYAFYNEISGSSSAEDREDLSGTTGALSVGADMGNILPAAPAGVTGSASAYVDFGIIRLFSDVNGPKGSDFGWETGAFGEFEEVFTPLGGTAGESVILTVQFTVSGSISQQTIDSEISHFGQAFLSVSGPLTNDPVDERNVSFGPTLDTGETAFFDETFTYEFDAVFGQPTSVSFILSVSSGDAGDGFESFGGPIRAS